MLNHLIAAYNGLLCSVLVCLVSAGVRLDFRWPGWRVGFCSNQISHERRLRVELTSPGRAVTWDNSTNHSRRTRNVHLAHLKLQKKFLQFRAEEKFQVAALEIESIVFMLKTEVPTTGDIVVSSFWLDKISKEGCRNFSRSGVSGLDLLDVVFDGEPSSNLFTNRILKNAFFSFSTQKVWECRHFEKQQHKNV
jgi:hypothetical protein